MGGNKVKRPDEVEDVKEGIQKPGWKLKDFDPANCDFEPDPDLEKSPIIVEEVRKRMILD